MTEVYILIPYLIFALQYFLQEEIDTGANQKDFQVVMSQLILRYFRKKDTEAEESEVDGLRKELAELRSLLRDALAPA